MYLDLIPVVLVISIWDHSFKFKKLILKIVNEAVVQIKKKSLLGSLIVSGQCRLELCIKIFRSNALTYLDVQMKCISRYQWRTFRQSPTPCRLVSLSCTHEVLKHLKLKVKELLQNSLSTNVLRLHTVKALYISLNSNISTISLAYDYGLRHLIIFFIIYHSCHPRTHLMYQIDFS